MRVTLLLVGVMIALVACSTTPSAPLLTDEERCARFSGYWSNGACRSH